MDDYLTCSQMNDLLGVSKQESPEDYVCRKEFWEIFSNLDLLPRDLCILKQRFVFGLAYAELGVKLGISTNRVRQIDVRAKLRLMSPKVMNLFGVFK